MTSILKLLSICTSPSTALLRIIFQENNSFFVFFSSLSHPPPLLRFVRLRSGEMFQEQRNPKIEGKALNMRREVRVGVNNVVRE